MRLSTKWLWLAAGWLIISIFWSLGLHQPFIGIVCTIAGLLSWWQHLRTRKIGL